MKRLIEKGLMYGNLFHVNGIALVDRYNRALEHLTGKRTALDDFYIDISGYSPEIGHELNDTLYLNHAGVNRQFVLLSADQKRCPLLNAKFSTSRAILRQFIEDNEAALFALTAHDAVAGELVNSVYSVNDPRRLFDIRAIDIEADTTAGTVRNAEALGQKIDQFLGEEDAWFDDVLIADMIKLAAKTGDVTRNPVQLKTMRFEQRNFWTDHFGGLYLFQDAQEPTILGSSVPDDLPLPSIDLRQRNQVARWLDENGLVEPIVKARGIDAGAVLRQKMDFVLVDAMTTKGINLRGATRRDLRGLARQHSQLLPEEFHGLASLVNWAENGGAWPRITSDHPAYFYTLRAADHTDTDLVNQLLAELTPKDVRQLFICHKELFYEEYGQWSEAKKTYVVDFLVAEYQVDKIGARTALFGREEEMAEPTVSERRIRAVGPWGAVRR
ncbi:MAG: DUF6638 family protein [Paracoccaceae bacterium]